MNTSSPARPAAPVADDRFPDDAARWDALCRRDPAADAAFCYSALTTGVYCRPSCAARRQQRGWRAIRQIPAGATATYGEIARRIGRPEAVRALIEREAA